MELNSRQERAVVSLVDDPEGYSSPVNRAVARMARSLVADGVPLEFVYAAVLASADPQ